MDNRPLPTEQILTMLAVGPSRLTAITTGLTPSQLLAFPEPGEWSARDVLAHLRACADIWGKYMEEILTQDKPTIKAVNPRTWIKNTNYLELEFHPSLQVFTDQRAGLLALLRPLAPGGWSRTGIVTGAGKPLEKTVFSFAERLATHERTHLKQMERIANTMRMGQ